MMYQLFTTIRLKRVTVHVDMQNIHMDNQTAPIIESTLTITPEDIVEVIEVVYIC